MAQNYETVKYSRSQVKKAGKAFVSPDTSDEDKKAALEIINNWRAAHSFPLQTIYMHIRNSFGAEAIIAQRLKRKYSITQKLVRFPNMSLTSMQDIGGCRVIVESIDQIYSIVNQLKHSRMRHVLKEEYDYISNPKADGYRSYHMVYSYVSDRNPTYNGLFIEIQIRTHIQHLWATAVETMDTFTGDPLKNGRGNQTNREFFILVSRLLQIYEASKYSAEKVKHSEALLEFIEFEKKNNVLRKLKTIQLAVQVVEKDDSGNPYYILHLDRKNHRVQITSYSKKELEKATDDYAALETEKSDDDDIVLVSTTSHNSLKKAYPNYFSDVSEFIGLIESFIK